MCVFPECDDAIPLIKIQQERQRETERKKKERNEKNTMI